MHVNPRALRTGANVADDAAGHAEAGAQRLGLAGVTAGIFGDFDTAHSFHTALGAAQDSHRDALQGHHRTLTGIADNVRTAVTTFTAMDYHNGQLLRDVITGTGQ